MEIIFGAISVILSVISAGIFAVITVIVLAVFVEWIISKLNEGE